MDPLSLLVRLATSVPPPRFNTVNGGVLAAARDPPFFKNRVIRQRLGEPVQAALFDAP